MDNFDSGYGQHSVELERQSKILDLNSSKIDQFAFNSPYKVCFLYYNNIIIVIDHNIHRLQYTCSELMLKATRLVLT